MLLTGYPVGRNVATTMAAQQAWPTQTRANADNIAISNALGVAKSFSYVNSQGRGRDTGDARLSRLKIPRDRASKGSLNSSKQLGAVNHTCYRSALRAGKASRKKTSSSTYDDIDSKEEILNRC